MPDGVVRQRVIEIHLRDKKHDLSADDIKNVSKAFEGQTGADIEAIVN